jgi:LuxR family maltose regulon positive regulatory protein
VTSTILTTKTFIPTPRPSFVLRRRLLEQLDKALSRSLILISAPAGYGKTTLLSIWVKENDVPCVWISLDAEDNDLSLFLNYLITALQNIAPQAGQVSLSLLQSPQFASTESILTTLINELSAIPNDIVFVFDDYHLIDNQKVHTALIYLLDHLPLQVHLIISSRSDPPLQLSRLRARDQLVEIRQSDLRMTPDEANAFLNQSMGLDISMQQVDALELRTEGWVAGLQFAALSMRSKEDIDAFIREFSGSHRFVIDYLADEVLTQLPEDLRAFMHQTAIFDRFTAPLCDEVIGRDDSALILRQLEDSNLFLIPLDDQRQWYRFHQLFSDYLRTDLEQEDLAPFHIKASHWFMSHGLASEAVKHALASGDLDQAVYTISQAAPSAMEEAAFVSLSGWLDALPDQVVRQSAVLALSKSFLLFFTQTYQQAFPYAQAAQENLPPDAPSQIHGQLLSLQAHLALCQDELDNGIKYARDALEFLDEDDSFFRNLTLNILGQILEMKGDVISASDIYRQGFTSGYQSNERLGTMVVFTNLVFSLNELGRRKEGVALCEEVVADIGAETLSGRLLSDAVSLSWSLLSYEANQLVIASEQAQRALDTLTQVGISQGISWAQYILASVHLANGEWENLLHFTREGFQHASRTGTAEIHGSWFVALEAQASLHRGDLATAERWAEEMKYTPQDKPHHWIERAYFTYVRLLLAQKRFQDAHILLSTMDASARNAKRLRKLITIDLLSAQTGLAIGEEEQAIQRLENAVKLASPQDYRRAFLDESQVVLDLLPRVHHVAPLFVDELLRVSQVESKPITQPDALIEPLSERELEVLRLVARGLSNREIAEALFVTLGTVKKHLNNIFNKLYVKSRTQAVSRGRELNLFD